MTEDDPLDQESHNPDQQDGNRIDLQPSNLRMGSGIGGSKGGNMSSFSPGKSRLSLTQLGSVT